MEFSVYYEFAITRRIPWDDESERLRQHIADVRETISRNPDVEAVTVRSDLAKAQTVFEFRVFGSHREVVEDHVPQLVAEAIRDAGAYHQGMMSHDVEVRLRPKPRRLSGLRTPSWRVRRSSIVFERGAAHSVSATG